MHTLEKALETANMPHMLFYGPPGTGKTTCALAIAASSSAPSSLSLASSNSTPRTSAAFQSYATRSRGSPPPPSAPALPGIPPPYKILILDEADSMTGDAQSALRRTMETYSRVTRFFILCNYVSRIIEPIASRCAKFRFKPLGHDVMGERLRFIADRENLRLGEGVYEAAATHSGGDLRKAITLLQSAARLFGTEEITGKEITAVAGAVEAKDVATLVELCRKNQHDKAATAADALLKDGFPALQILTQLAEAVVADADNSDAMKARVCLRIAEADKALVDGADESPQLAAVVSVACQALEGGGDAREETEREARTTRRDVSTHESDENERASLQLVARLTRPTLHLVARPPRPSLSFEVHPEPEVDWFAL